MSKPELRAPWPPRREPATPHWCGFVAVGGLGFRVVRLLKGFLQRLLAGTFYEGLGMCRLSGFRI